MKKQPTSVIDVPCPYCKSKPGKYCWSPSRCYDGWYWHESRYNRIHYIRMRLDEIQRAKDRVTEAKAEREEAQAKVDEYNAIIKEAYRSLHRDYKIIREIMAA